MPKNVIELGFSADTNETEGFKFYRQLYGICRAFAPFHLESSTGLSLIFPHHNQGTLYLPAKLIH